MKRIANIEIIVLCYYRVPVSRVSTVSWQLYTTDSPLYYYINSASSETRSHYIADRIEFWNVFIPQINIPSYVETTSASFTSTSSSIFSSAVTIARNTTSSAGNITTPHNNTLGYNQSSTLTSKLPTGSLFNQGTTQGGKTEVTTLFQACADLQTIKTIYMISTFSLSGLVGLLIISIIVIIIKMKSAKQKQIRPGYLQHE